MSPRSLALAVAMMAIVVGCTPTLTSLRKDVLLPPVTVGGAAKGKAIAAKRCYIAMALVSKPLGDAAVNDAAWSVVDEQVIPSEARKALDANGIRLGLLTGSLPRDVEAMLNAPAPHRIEPTAISLPSGENSLFAMNAATPKATLILSRDGRTIGKDYTDVSGYFRVTASQDGPSGVNLRFVPELHHGAIQRRYAADASTNPYSVQQFVMKDSQQEDTLRELAASLTLQPGQTVVVGSWPDRPDSLGHFLFTEPEPNSDRLMQKLLLVRASQDGSGGFTIGAMPALPPGASMPSGSGSAGDQAPAAASTTSRPRRQAADAHPAASGTP